MEILELSPTDEAGMTHFYSLARQLYADDPAWAPASEGLLHPLLARADAILAQPIICIHEGVATARAVAIRHPNAPPGLGYIGFFDCLPNHSPAGQAVLAHAEAVLRARDVRLIHAPRVDNLLMGLVVSGFDRPQTILTTHNPPYYLDIFQQSGYQISERLYTYIFDRRSATDLSWSLPEVQTRVFDRHDLEAEIRIFHELQKEIFQSRSDRIDRTLAEDRQLIMSVLPILDDDLVIIAERAQRPVGILICLPDIYQVARGQPLDHARLVSIGVAPAYARRGIATAMGFHLARNLVDKGYRTLEGSLIRHSNVPPQNLAGRFAVEKGREFAILRKAID
jgi:ribosomal protein S18 acetylase RimI-like enzyme